MGLLLLMLVRFGRTMKDAFRERDLRRILFFLLIILASGTIFYHIAEKWNILDSLYFSVMTLSTVGSGTIEPSTAAGKIFTMIYILIGIGTMLSFINRVASHAQRESAVKTLIGLDPYEEIAKGVDKLKNG